MQHALDSRRTRSHVNLALTGVPHDRWVLGGLRDGRLRVITQSPPPATPRGAVRAIYEDLSPLARRCLYERHPLSITSVSEPMDDVDWESDWPALLYVPVGLPSARPVGILIVGSRVAHWYTHEEIDRAWTLAISLTATVTMVTGPLGRLTPRERRFALLIAEGLSNEEISRALALDDQTVRRVSDGVLRKLSIRSRHEVRDVVALTAPNVRSGQ